MRAAIYARYSSDRQSDASIDDQIRICHRRIEREGWVPGDIYSDHALSGATALRPGYQRMLEDARAGRFDVVLAESLDRLSRDQEHIAALFKQLSFAGIQLVTVADGTISELHVGLKGTMSALYLKDLAQKTHRGLEGRVRKGKAAGGISYGYDLVRTIGGDGLPTTGERTINAAEAAVVRRIFTEFASGDSPRTIAMALNREGIPGPRGRTWGPSTIYGNWRRGTGIVNNELYTGRIVWNRQRFLKDPETGRRQARLNLPEEWVIEEVPALRIVDTDLWDTVKARQTATRRAVSDPGATRSERARRPRYLFSGLLTCAACDGGYVLVGKHHYGCANTRNRGTCTNRLTIRRDVLEETVLAGLRDRLMAPDLVAGFIDEYRKEYARLQREASASESAQRAELVSVERQIANIVEAVKQGLFAPAMNAELDALEARKAGLDATLENTPKDLPALHPGIAGIYRRKVADLTSALNEDNLRSEAAGIIRSLIGSIRLVPHDDRLLIELEGELAAILALTNDNRPRPEARGRQITLVAGARNSRFLRLVESVVPRVAA